MFVVRLIVLVFLAAYSWSMGQTPPDGLNDFGKFVSLLFFIVAPALYMLPTFEAWKNKQPNLVSIALVNFFLGWSLIGWVVAAAWAFKKPGLAVAATPTTIETSTKDTIKCPYCAENILSAAIKCKHCGSSLQGPAEIVAAPPIQASPAMVDADAMQQYGITLQNGQYFFESHRYDRLSDAISYAKLQSNNQ